jgi:hypothetical protein
MAAAAGHKFGQVIGEFCEAAIEPLLQAFATKHGLYLDRRGPRAARTGNKVRWVDSYGNGHDLDFVLERGGTPETVGTPVAFIESAWRRYTKHSRNKAQEIQGAVLPIAERHYFAAPMLGCILAGVYTAGALEQLKSVGFRVLYFSYASVVEAFKAVGIDAGFDEGTADAEFNRRLRAWASVSERDRRRVRKRLLGLNQRNVEEFMLHLELAVKRQVTAVRILPLHGSPVECLTIQEAIAKVESYGEADPHGPLVKYEVLVRYDNGDKIEAAFHDKAATISFLLAFKAGHWTPAIATAAKVE